MESNHAPYIELLFDPKAESEDQASLLKEKIDKINSKINSLFNKGAKKPKRYSYILRPEKWFKGSITEIKKFLKEIKIKGMIIKNTKTNIQTYMITTGHPIDPQEFEIDEIKWKLIDNNKKKKLAILYLYNVFIDEQTKVVLKEILEQVGKINQIRYPSEELNEGTVSISFDKLYDTSQFLTKITLFRQEVKFLWHKDVVKDFNTYIDVTPQNNAPDQKKDESPQDIDPPQNNDDPPQKNDDPPQKNDDPPQKNDDPPQNNDDLPQNKDGPPQNTNSPQTNVDPPQKNDDPPEKNNDPPQKNDQGNTASPQNRAAQQNNITMKDATTGKAVYEFTWETPGNTEIDDGFKTAKKKKNSSKADRINSKAGSKRTRSPKQDSPGSRCIPKKPKTTSESSPLRGKQ